MYQKKYHLDGAEETLGCAPQTHGHFYFMLKTSFNNNMKKTYSSRLILALLLLRCKSKMKSLTSSSTP